MSKKSPKPSEKAFEEDILAAEIAEAVEASASAALAPVSSPAPASSPADAFFSAIRSREPNQSSLAKTALSHSEYSAHVDASGFNALTLALLSDKFELAKVLVELGSDVNLSTKAMGWNPLVVACGRASGEDSVAHLLLAKGANPSAKTHDGLYALTSACSYGNVGLAKKLLDAGAKACPDDAGWLPIIAAAGSGSVELLDLLVERGADANQPLAPNHGFRAIHQASKTGHADVVARLISMGADANSLDNEGRTPLHYAAQRSDAGIVAILLKAGADKSLETVAGKTPAELCHNPAIAKTLLVKDEHRVKHALSGKTKKSAKANDKAKAKSKVKAKIEPTIKAKGSASKISNAKSQKTAMQSLTQSAADQLSTAVKKTKSVVKAGSAKTKAPTKAPVKKAAKPLVKKAATPTTSAANTAKKKPKI